MCVSVVTETGGLCCVETSPALYTKHSVLTANAVVEVLPNRPFWIHVSNWGNAPRVLCKRTVVGYAHGRPAVLLAPVSGRETAPDISPDEPDEGDEQGSESPPDWRREIDLDHIKDDALRHSIMDMLSRHSSLWSGRLGELKTVQQCIETPPASKPIRAQPYRMGPDRRASVEAEISRMLDLGVIEPTNSEWASPIVIVPEKDVTTRFCVDYRRLNAITVSDCYPLPQMDDCLDSLCSVEVFTTLEYNSGNWQIPVREKDKDKTTFTTHVGMYQYAACHLA